MPAKTKNLYQRGDVWWGRLELAGHCYRSSLRTTDAREAAERLKAWRTKLERKAVGFPEDHRFSEAVERWDREVLPRAVKTATARRYMTSIRQLNPLFGHLRMSDITMATIASYISSRSGRATNATVQRDLTALSKLLSACVSWGWRTDNPAKTFDRSIAREQRDPIRLPTPEDLAAVLAVAPAGMAGVLRLLDATGARENEIVTLEHSDIRWQAQQITFLKTKTNRPRTIAWASPAGDAGPVLLPQRARIGPLFVSEQGGPYANFSSNFARVLQRAIAAEAEAGRELLPFRVHDLRHAFAVRWLREGGNIYRLQKHLGHKSLTTTEIYLDFVTSEEADLAQNPAQRAENRQIVL